MKTIRWTPLALNDFKAISLYIEEQRNLETANRICRLIYDAVQTLRSFSVDACFVLMHSVVAGIRLAGA